MTQDQIESLYRLQDIIGTLTRFEHLSKRQRDLQDEAARIVREMINAGPRLAHWRAHFTATATFQDKPEEVLNYLVVHGASQARPVDMSTLKLHFGENVHKSIQRARQSAKESGSPFTIVCQGGKAWTAATASLTLRPQ